MGTLKFPLYVKHEQRYETTFNLYSQTFPRLPTAEFGKVLRPPFPDWFVCGNVVKILREQSKKRVQGVVPTKYTLDSFKGHLHVGIERICVLTPILEDVE